MTMRVHHYHPVNTSNSGDALVAHALRQALQQHFGPCVFDDIPAINRGQSADVPVGLCRANIARSNAEADLVLIGGSNLLEPRKVRSAGECNIPLVIEPDALPSLRVPMLLAGMGTGSSFGKGIRSYSLRAQQSLRWLFSKALGHAVRDETTVQRLAQIGIATHCTGCPVTFLTERPVAAQDSRLPLLVSFPPARILKRLGGTSFMRLAMRYVGWLRAEGVPLVVTLHDETDWPTAQTWVLPGIDIFSTQNLHELIARFEDSRGIVGFRLHAGLLGLGLGKPLVPVSVDWRGRAFVETFGLSDLAARPFRLGQLSKLQRATRLLLENDRAYLARLDQVRQHYRERHETLFRAAAQGILRRAAS
jgi:Polysaccharide pyruvyl transferase